MFVSIVLPVHNASRWIDECFQSITSQTYSDPFEVSIYDDASTDDSLLLISKWIPVLESRSVSVVISSSSSTSSPRGVGFARNRAVEQSRGTYLCFLDADDTMHPRRISIQLEMALQVPLHSIIGSNFVRDPVDSTARLTQWYRSMTPSMLYLHQYRETTLAMVTWFMSRANFDAVGGFDEGYCSPEDLIFFHRHLDLGGGLHKSTEDLVVYRYHPGQTSFKIHRLTLTQVRMDAMCRRVFTLASWGNFTIWGFGRDGKKFFKWLPDSLKGHVAAFCDVSIKKIGNVYIHQSFRVPIVHFRDAKPPFVICVAMDRTNGELEANLQSLGLVEGLDYYHFN